MSTLTQPPSVLAQAIAKASAAFKVPADVLTGIWRVESASSYPNPYVNSLGYGGLFGTKDYNGPPQEQANLAASILADNIRSHGGNLSQALSAYSGGGYTSVPGETTFGVLKVTPKGLVPLDSSGNPVANPQSGLQQTESLLGKGAKAAANAAGLGGVAGVADQVSNVFANPSGTLGHALLWAGLLLLGVALVFVGLMRATGARPGAITPELSPEALAAFA